MNDSIYERIYDVELAIKDERKRNTVNTKQWFASLILALIPFCGFIYGLCSMNNKNRSIASHSKALAIVNIVYSLILSLVIGLFTLFYVPDPGTQFSLNKTAEAKTEKIVKKASVKKKTVVTKKKAKKVVAKKKTKAKEKETKVDSKDLIFEDGEATFFINGSKCEFPCKSSFLAEKGWNSESINPDPDNASNTVATWTDIGGSTAYIYYPTGELNVSKIEITFVDKATSILGLSSQSSINDADKALKARESEDMSLYDGSGNGTKIYNFKGYKVSVSLLNNYVTSVSIERSI